MLDVVGIFRCFQKIGDVIGIQADERLITQLFEEFNPVYPERPVADNNGGIGPNPSTWLFFTATRLNPKLIIESRGGWDIHPGFFAELATKPKYMPLISTRVI
jgi:hypothetical protein